MNAVVTNWCAKEMKGFFFLRAELEDAIDPTEYRQIAAFFDAEWRTRPAFTPVFRFVPIDGSNEALALQMVERTSVGNHVVAEQVVGLVGWGLALLKTPA